MGGIAEHDPAGRFLWPAGRSRMWLMSSRRLDEGEQDAVRDLFRCGGRAIKGREHCLIEIGPGSLDEAEGL